ncbi:DUF3106 domain-containing protein [Amphiplicatus metriothermophilus]|uniref:DUF3106 domain-containing protein n=1 Tax=Amphiplicatus metriothermophilus TaxID=1519374 RepID=A0A239Q078_9PROT|nr:DUF3106 domain-containing protein [Amphiplicatus metriothermophilus]MBB5520149.1 hypothetical protein [Amphiplicatus metriothermophilus]SNT75738.1 Protein of unknown function [Amphiplicatus metriothermophilus]
MRHSLVFGVAFGIVAVLSCPAPASAQSWSTNLRWEALSESERALADRLAADFFESSLRPAQAEAIETRTSELYRSAPPAARARFRAERRAAWREMSESQRNALRGAKRPAYRNLAEAQKAPFRRHALDLLSAGNTLADRGRRAAVRSADL